MILLLMCAAIGLTQAQAQLSFGVKAGANFSTISKIDLSSIGPGGKALSGLFESKYMPGYHVGLYTRYNLTPAMGVQAELLYSMMGYKITSPLIADASVKTQLHYLTLPVLFRYTLPNIGLYAELGPQAGFFLKDNITVTGSIDDRSSDITKGGSKQAAPFDLSGVVALRIGHIAAGQVEATLQRRGLVDAHVRTQSLRGLSHANLRNLGQLVG